MNLENYGVLKKGLAGTGFALAMITGLLSTTGVARSESQDIILTRKYLIISGEHSDVHFELKDAAHLKISKGAKIGGNNKAAYENKLANGSMLSIEGGGAITGSLELENSKFIASGNQREAVNITGAVNAISSSLDLKWLKISDQIQGNENIVPTQVLRFANSKVDIGYSDISTDAEDGIGITSFGQQSSLLKLTHSHVEVSGAALRVSGNSTKAVLSYSDLAAGGNGIIISPGKYAGENTRLNITGSTVLSTGKVKADSLHRQNQEGINNVAIQSLPGKDHIFVRNSRLVARGPDSAGIIASQANEYTLNSTEVTGGKYGILITRLPSLRDYDSNPSSLTLNNALVSGQDAAIHISGLRNALIQIKGGTVLNSSSKTLISTQGGVANSIVEVSDPETHLYGDLISDDKSKIEYIFNNGASLQGRIAGRKASVHIDDGAYWQLSGPSYINSISASNDSTIILSREDKPGNILSVVGDYTGNMNNLVFNAILNSDNSVNDKLVVTGDTKGKTKVYVNNVGGDGAKTRNGIELIHVNGTSAGEFLQQGRIVAGLYDYNLVKKGKNWYLESGREFNKKEQWERPEVGNYLANMEGSVSMFSSQLHDRVGDIRKPAMLDNDQDPETFWLRQRGGKNHFRDSREQLNVTGYTFTTQLGGSKDLWQSRDNMRWLLGAMIGQGYNHNDASSNETGYSSKGDVKGYSTGIYSTWYQNWMNNTGAFIDGQVMLNFFKNRVNGERIHSEEYHSRELRSSIESGYTFELYDSKVNDKKFIYYLEPDAQVSWSRLSSETFYEANGSRVQLPLTNNIESRLGVKTTMRYHPHEMKDAGSDVSSFLELDWRHNTRSYKVALDNSYGGQSGKTNTAEVKLGLEGDLNRNIHLWGEINKQFGDNGYRSISAMMGLKYIY